MMVSVKKSKTHKLDLLQGQMGINGAKVVKNN